MKQALTIIMENYLNSIKDDYNNNPIANYIRHDTPNAIISSVGIDSSNFLVQGSAGAGKWAEIP